MRLTQLTCCGLLVLMIVQGVACSTSKRATLDRTAIPTALLAHPDRAIASTPTAPAGKPTVKSSSKMGAKKTAAHASARKLVKKIADPAATKSSD